MCLLAETIGSYQVAGITLQITYLLDHGPLLISRQER